MKPSNNVSILAKLAREDINIFNAHKESDGTWIIEYEYGWSPNDYKTKWTKAILSTDAAELGQALTQVLVEVRMVKDQLGN